jgi:hypothetical protein
MPAFYSHTRLYNKTRLTTNTPAHGVGWTVLLRFGLGSEQLHTRRTDNSDWRRKKQQRDYKGIALP